MKRIAFTSTLPMALAASGMVAAIMGKAVMPAETARRGMAARCATQG